MSGSYQLDGELFPKNPIAKRWQRQQVALSGVGESIFQAPWQFEMTFSHLAIDGEVSFFENKWFIGGLHTAVLPHPKTGNLTGFTGVNISLFDYSFSDVESDSWTESGPRLTLSNIKLNATGTV